jgi:hypothetical protein
MVLLPLSLFFPIHGSSQALGLDLVELNGQRHGKVAVSTALKLELFWPLFIPQGFTVSGFNCNHKVNARTGGFHKLAFGQQQR